VLFESDGASLFGRMGTEELLDLEPIARPP
jgi:hypothetical protein